jgi:uncharacterized cupredoxin-like copper-binding protein
MALAAAACSSSSGSVSQAGSDTVVIQMRDNHFEPSRITVKRGEAVHFRFINRGGLPHEAFFGSKKAQAAHEDGMRMSRKDDHGGHMSMAEAVTVKPGKTGDLRYTFEKQGETLIGCHEPGHYASGMVVRVTVK